MPLALEFVEHFFEKLAMGVSLQVETDEIRIQILFDVNHSSIAPCKVLRASDGLALFDTDRPEFSVFHFNLNRHFVAVGKFGTIDTVAPDFVG
jgi:hypothetical protein